ncbi:MAG: PKD domain-containing protein [Lewinellaceae bacterium]|nr:PKD domain-containing protein [Lewinellaceae bacterium]
MTKFFLSLLAVLLNGVALSAQITIDGSDIPPFGAVLTFGEDTLVAGLEPGPAGANQSWDFSGLGAQTNFQNSVEDPAQTPAGAQFTDATFALVSGNTYSYAKLTADALVVVGGSLPLPSGGQATARFDPPQRLIPAPATYGAAFDNEFGFDITIDGSLFGVDSARVRRIGMQSAEIDGWGTITVPSGAYQVLRQRTETITVDSISAYWFGVWFNLDPMIDSTVTYEWWAKDGRAQVLSLDYDFQGNALSAIHLTDYSESQVAPVAAFSYELQGNGQVQFTDESQFGPIGWLWNFGDGTTSLEQNPAHTYSASGMFEVCLTVANGAGQDVNCQMIDVMVSSDEEALGDYAIQAYPSPFADAFTLETGPLAGREVQLLLFNSYGQLARRERVNNAPQRLSVPAGGLPSGVYRLVVEAGGKRVKVLSVVKR